MTDETGAEQGAQDEGMTLDEARAIAVEKFPKAKPMEDLLVGNTLDEVLAAVESISERLPDAEPEPDENPLSGLAPQHETVQVQWEDPGKEAGYVARLDAFIRGSRESK